MRKSLALLLLPFAIFACRNLRLGQDVPTPMPTPSESAILASPLAAALDAKIEELEPKLIAWRRHLHQYPELSNREVETSRYVAQQLRDMGLSPRTGVARHGVVAVIEGGLPGPVVALRADMDALPVSEEVDLPFASRATALWEGKTVGVMHACGHDAHTAMLLTAAAALVSVRQRLPGKVLLIFQPAEESVPREEQPAGAELMVQEGVLDNPKVEAIFGLHVMAQQPSGLLAWRTGPVMAATDRFEIIVHGRQTHGAKPWAGVDPIVIGSEIVGALQTIVSRKIDLLREPAVLTVGQFEAGVRNNIVPDRARLVGTIRSFDATMRQDIHEKLRQIAQGIAVAHGARAEVILDRGYPVTINHPELVDRMCATLIRIGGEQIVETPKIAGAEDFSFYAQKVPGLFVFLGVTPKDKLASADSNHSPRFFLDESALPRGVRAMAHLAADYLFAGAAKKTDATSSPASIPENARARFLREIGFDKNEEWESLEVSKSLVTETRRKIYFSKEAVTQALLEHGGGEGFQSKPMNYPDRTVFIAESLQPDGTRIDTEVLITRREGPPEFLLFDAKGEESKTFHQPGDPPDGPPPGNVPRVCMGCHLGTGYFDPMMSFPTEPKERRVEIDPRFRDVALIKKFLEGYHRGSHLFGPYGSIWLAKLKADSRDGKLSAQDRPYFDLLRKKYPELK